MANLDMHLDHNGIILKPMTICGDCLAVMDNSSGRLLVCPNCNKRFSMD